MLIFGCCIVVVLVVVIIVVVVANLQNIKKHINKEKQKEPKQERATKQ